MRACPDKTWKPSGTGLRRNMDSEWDIELHSRQKETNRLMWTMQIQRNLRRMPLYCILQLWRLVGSRLLMSLRRKTLAGSDKLLYLRNGMFLLAASLRRGDRGPLRSPRASTVNPLYDGPKAGVRRQRSSGSFSSLAMSTRPLGLAVVRRLS